MTRERTRQSQLIVFLDFTRFDQHCQHVDDLEIADTMDAHYRRVTQAVHKAGGRVIKFIGDATLLVFPAAAVNDGMHAILRLIEGENRVMAEKGWDCQLRAKAHFGKVVAGDFGPEEEQRFDIFGRAVNATARLKSTGAVTLSREAYQQLSPELRRGFQLSTAAAAYSSA